MEKRVKMKITLRQVAKEIGISGGYLSEIINGKKGCSENLMKIIKSYFPDLEFYNFIEPRYKVRLKGEK